MNNSLHYLDILINRDYEYAYSQSNGPQYRYNPSYESAPEPTETTNERIMRKYFEGSSVHIEDLSTLEHLSEYIMYCEANLTPLLYEEWVVIFM